MKRLIVLRGIPGSGKSTKARTVYPTAVVCSADTFHMRPDPANPGSLVYDWKAENQGAAHASCQKACADAMERGEPLVLIDNTNIRYCDYAPYVAMAMNNGYEVLVHEVRVKTARQLATCVQRNVHKVPAEAVCRMLLSFQEDVVNRLVSEDMEGVTP